MPNETTTREATLETVLASDNLRAAWRAVKANAGAAGVDPLGLYIPPFAYAQMQIVEQAIRTVGSLDEGKLAANMHQAEFDTVVGKIRFAANGEWAEPRLLLIQYQGIVGNDVEQFKQAGKQVILYPPQYKSGDLKVPFDSTKK